MGALDGAMQSLAVSLAGSLGTEADVEIQRVNGYDPSTRRGTVASESVNVRCVLGAYDTAQVTGSVQATDLPVYVPALEVEQVQEGDLFTFDGTRHRVVSVRTHYAGALPALYECQVRA